MRRETGEERGQRWRRGKYSGLVTLGEELMWAGVKLRWARRSGPGRPRACCWSGNCRAMSEWACASRAKSAVGCSHGRCSTSQLEEKRVADTSRGSPCNAIPRGARQPNASGSVNLDS